MKTVKKMLALLLALAMMLCLVACGETPSGSTPGQTDPSEPSQPTQSTPVPTTPSADDGKITYTVTFTDADGKGLPGAVLQLCLDTNCYPCVASENGVATIDLEEAEYKVSFISVPSGYKAEEAYYFESGSTELTIVLEAA